MEKEKYYTSKELEEMTGVKERTTRWRIEHRHYKNVKKIPIKFMYLIPESDLSKEDIEKVKKYNKNKSNKGN